jgi:hypothetical protein
MSCPSRVVERLTWRHLWTQSGRCVLGRTLGQDLLKHNHRRFQADPAEPVLACLQASSPAPTIPGHNSAVLAELAGARAALRGRQTAIGRYLRAFETGRSPESTCAHRLADDPGLGHWRRPGRNSAQDRAGSRRRRSRAAQATPGHGGGPDRVESRSSIQPLFVAPTVRTRTGSRRRTGIEPA